MKAAAVIGNATSPSGGPSGGQATVPGVPAPSGSAPAEFRGAGSALAINGILGVVDLFSGLLF